MITTHTDLTDHIPALSLMDADPRECVFFDIETTGFQPAFTRVYLIGAAFQTKKGWRVTQWMIEDPSEEDMLLRIFTAFLKPYRTLIHFNGNQFDIPYLQKKYEAVGLPCPFTKLTPIDIFRDLSPWRSLLGLTHMNQKALEAFLGMTREDQLGGGELIPVFRRFCRSADAQDQHLLLLHNLEDVKGMLRLTDLYSLGQLLNSVTPSARLSGNTLVLSASYPHPFPVSIHAAYGYGEDILPSTSISPDPEESLAAAFPGDEGGNEARLSIKENRAAIKIPVYQGELLHFFKDYRNYYYLPREDEALHKSVASFVDRRFREQATARTCYTKRTGSFLPAFGYKALPLFQSNYEDARRWFLLPDIAHDTTDEAFLQDYWHCAMRAFMQA